MFAPLVIDTAPESDQSENDIPFINADRNQSEDSSHDEADDNYHTQSKVSTSSNPESEQSMTQYREATIHLNGSEPNDITMATYRRDISLSPVNDQLAFETHDDNNEGHSSVSSNDSQSITGYASGTMMSPFDEEPAENEIAGRGKGSAPSKTRRKTDRVSI